MLVQRLRCRLRRGRARAAVGRRAVGRRAVRAAVRLRAGGHAGPCHQSRLFQAKGGRAPSPRVRLLQHHQILHLGGEARDCLAGLAVQALQLRRHVGRDHQEHLHQPEVRRDGYRLLEHAGLGHLLQARDPHGQLVLVLPHHKERSLLYRLVLRLEAESLPEVQCVAAIAAGLRQAAHARRQLLVGFPAHGQRLQARLPSVGRLRVGEVLQQRPLQLELHRRRPGARAFQHDLLVLEGRRWPAGQPLEQLAQLLHLRGGHRPVHFALHAGTGSVLWPAAVMSSSGLPQGTAVQQSHHGRRQPGGRWCRAAAMRSRGPRRGAGAAGRVGAGQLCGGRGQSGGGRGRLWSRWALMACLRALLANCLEQP
mmetsp:Transcript_27157/g.70453  ORF Transcript_27157/g.70453 Transcript_27157/m.70453 type:complete len:367 (+) Transcript_27157:31-1131(+)